MFQFCIFKNSLVQLAVEFENETFLFFSPIFLWTVHQRESLQELIHVRGCIHAVNLWMSDNIGATVALCCAIGLPQVIGNSTH